MVHHIWNYGSGCKLIPYLKSPSEEYDGLISAFLLSSANDGETGGSSDGGNWSNVRGTEGGMVGWAGIEIARLNFGGEGAASLLGVDDWDEEGCEVSFTSLSPGTVSECSLREDSVGAKRFPM